MKMGKLCVALGCHHRDTDGSGLRFHRFPAEKYEYLLADWINAINRKEWIPKLHSRICSNHFTEDDYTEPNKKGRLKHEAVPSIFCDYADLQAQSRKVSKRNKKKIFSMDRSEVCIKVDVEDLNSIQDCSVSPSKTDSLKSSQDCSIFLESASLDLQRAKDHAYTRGKRSRNCEKGALRKNELIKSEQNTKQDVQTVSSLSMLDRILQDNEATNNLVAIIDDTEDTQDADEDVIGTVALHESPSKQSNDVTRFYAHTKTRKRKHTDSKSESIDKAIYDYVAKNRTKDGKTVKDSIVPDEDEMFMLAQLATLRRLPARKKALAKLEIHKLLFNADNNSDQEVGERLCCQCQSKIQS